MSITTIIALLNAIAGALTAANPVLSKIVEQIALAVGAGKKVDDAMAEVVAKLHAGLTEEDFTAAIAHIDAVTKIIQNAANQDNEDNL